MIEFAFAVALAVAVAAGAGWLSLRLTRGFPLEGEHGWHGLLAWGDQDETGPGELRRAGDAGVVPDELPPVPRRAA